MQKAGKELNVQDWACFSNGVDGRNSSFDSADDDHFVLELVVFLWFLVLENGLKQLLHVLAVRTDCMGCSGM